MPGEDENHAALERLMAVCDGPDERAALELAIDKMATRSMASRGEVVNALDKFCASLKKPKPEEVAAIKEILKMEIAEDHATARRKGLTMDSSKINLDELALDVVRRDSRRVDWRHPRPPGGWFFDQKNRDGDTIWFYRNPAMSLLVGLSCELEDDGRAYIHLSVSHRSRIPTWGELGKAKEAFIGDVEAYQVFPPRSRYVNIHPHCLNLYAPLAAPVLPDFTRGRGGI